MTEPRDTARVPICSGLSFPMFPMRPTEGRMLRSRTQASQLVREVRQFKWVMQPKLSGDRVCLAVVRGRVYVQDRHGDWYQHPISNRHDFLSLEDHTALDGVVYKGLFHPFEALAVDGKSFLEAGVEKRVAEAERLVDVLGHDWMFAEPEKDWLLGLSANSPQWAGVVLKKAQSHYLIQADAKSASLAWIKKRWI